MVRSQARAIEAFRRAGGVLTTSRARRRGVHQRDIYALRDAGLLEPLSRGVYRLTELPPLSDPDLVTVALAVPKGVVALISALHFHGLTAEIPHEVSVALPRGTRVPRLEWPPTKVYHMSGEMFSFGIEQHERDGVQVRVYSEAKTVADCFKFRNRIGIDVAVQALSAGLAERRFSQAEALHAARVCRVERVIRPYLEAIQ